MVEILCFRAFSRFPSYLPTYGLVCKYRNLFEDLGEILGQLTIEATGHLGNGPRFSGGKKSCVAVVLPESTPVVGWVVE